MKKRIFALILCFALAFSALGFTGCGGGGGNGGNTVTVTFDLNYEGAPAASTQEIAKDDIAEQPADPQRENYEFTDWYYEAACTTKVDFEVPIAEDTTFYAGWNKVNAVITFDSQGGSDVAPVAVAIGTAPSQPKNPTKSGFLFGGWYKDSACTQAFSFSEALSEDITVYAKWTEVSEDSDIVTVTYSYNYEGAPDGGVYLTVDLEKNSRTEAPGEPRREADAESESGYRFNGWYTDAAMTQLFDFAFTRVTESMTLYAKWNKIYVLEAEYTPLEGKMGVGYSSGASGTGMIVQDKNGVVKASNGYWVSYLYYEGAFLEFNFHVDKAVTDATVDLRLSVEFYDFVMTSDNFLVQVNGKNLSYSAISLTGAIVSEDDKRPFEDYKIATNVSLQEGDNVIKLVVNNKQSFEIGTMQAYAPLIDCLYISTDADLTWEPILTNVGQ